MMSRIFLFHRLTWTQCTSYFWRAKNALSKFYDYLKDPPTDMNAQHATNWPIFQCAGLTGGRGLLTTNQECVNKNMGVGRRKGGAKATLYFTSW